MPTVPVWCSHERTTPLARSLLHKAVKFFIFFPPQTIFTSVTAKNSCFSSSPLQHTRAHPHAHTVYSTCGIGDPQGRRQAPTAMVSGCRSVRHNGEELPWGSTWEGRTMEPQCRRSSRGHAEPICQPGRAARSTPASDLLLAHTMEGGRSRAWGNGGEFPAYYNKMESSILETLGIGHSWATPWIHHNNNCTEVIWVGQRAAADN